MSNITDTGFLLRKFPYSESSLVLKAFTREHGVVSFMAKGARRQNSRLHGLLEPGLHLQFLFPSHARGEMRVLADVALLRDFPAVRDDIARQGLAQVFGEVLLKYLPDGARAPDFHDLLLRRLELLETEADGDALQAHLAAFLLDFCKLSGFQPQFRLCAQCGERISGTLVEFSVERGGPVCGQCRSGEEGSVRMRETTLRWLRAVQEHAEERAVSGGGPASLVADTVADDAGSRPAPGLGRADKWRACEFMLLYLGRHAGGQKPLKSLEVWRGLMEG